MVDHMIWHDFVNLNKYTHVTEKYAMLKYDMIHDTKDKTLSQ